MIHLRFVNFCLLTLGACFFYCLSNVSSIVVRQLLNWMIKKMDVKVEDRSFLCFKKKRRYMGLGLRPPKGISNLLAGDNCCIEHLNVFRIRYDI